ncbi:hypothetical protein ACFE04_021295 [Oxalis oulophora]
MEKEIVSLNDDDDSRFVQGSNGSCWEDYSLIRLPKQTLHLYPELVLSAISEAVGQVVKVDYNTSGFQRAKFARVAILINLEQPHVSKFEIDGELQRVPKQTDFGNDAPTSGIDKTDVSSNNFGAWMKMDHRKNSRKVYNQYGKENPNPFDGSRFAALSEGNYQIERTTQKVDEQLAPKFTSQDTRNHSIMAKEDPKSKNSFLDNSMDFNPSKSVSGPSLAAYQPLGKPPETIQVQTILFEKIDILSKSPHNQSIDGNTRDIESMQCENEEAHLSGHKC